MSDHEADEQGDPTLQPAGPAVGNQLVWPAVAPDNRQQESDDDDFHDAMSDFDTINTPDDNAVLAKLASVKVTWHQDDIHYWFFEIELQMTLINIKSQWLKRVVLANNLPQNVRGEVKELLKQTKAEAGGTIYKELKAEIVALFGPRTQCTRVPLLAEIAAS